MIERIEFSKASEAKNNFDFLRLLFAFSVFIAHFSILTGIPLYWPISAAQAVAGFFVISGFLITKSYYRSSTIKNYLLKRAKRIIPAYLLIVLLCAFGLSFISELSFSSYFKSSQFYAYLSSNSVFLNFLQPTLPGVFSSNIFPFINGSLWTIKVEIGLYLSIPICAYLIRKTNAKWTFIALYLLSFAFIQTMNLLYKESGKGIYEILSRQLFGQIIYLISGLVLLFYFDLLQKNIKYLLPIASAIVIFHLLRSNIISSFFFPFSFSIMIIGIAYNFKYLNNIAKYGDISYGIYLFHYPIIQIISTTSLTKYHPVVTFILSLSLVLILSFASWHLLEKSFLKR